MVIFILSYIFFLLLGFSKIFIWKSDLKPSIAVILSTPALPTDALESSKSCKF